MKKAIMLHPTLNLDGTIDDISNFEALIHLLTIGWKALFACIPPPHYLGGWPAFFISLVAVSGIMLMIGEFARLFGCVTDIGTYITSITIVAIGVSIPDAVASWHAAIHSKYADNAIVSLYCSVSVNVFLGLGPAWLINTLN
jgi:solute carrier family 8 (sodium/calcium exchanger)